MRTSFEGVSEPHRRELQRTLQRARAGKERCTAFLATVLESPGDWRMTPLLANGQPAVVAWIRGERFGGAVLTVAKVGITRITVWNDPRFATGRRSAS